MKVSPSVALFATLALLAAVLHPGVVDNVDSRIVLRTTERILDAGTMGLAKDPSHGHWSEYGGIGTRGELQMKFGAGNCVLALPFALLGRLVLVPAGLDASRAAEAGVAVASCLWFAASGVLVFRIARRFLTNTGAVGAALLHAVASYALVYGRSAYLETPLTVLVLLAYDAALASREHPDRRGPALLLGFAAGGVLWIKHAAVLLLAGVLPVLLLDRNGRRNGVGTLLRAALPAVALGLAWMALNTARFGAPLSTGYAASARFDHPLAEGLRDLLASERGGLLFFAPAALAGIAGLPVLARADRGLAAGIGLAFAAVLPIYATFFSPFGGDAWGPRYLVPNTALLAVPAAVLLAAWFDAGGLRRFAATALVSSSVALQAAPSVVSFTEFWTVARRIGLDDPPPGRATARLLLAKVGATPPGPTERVRSPADFWLRAESPRLDLWPVRVETELPRLGRVAWVAWGALLCGLAGAGGLLAVGTRRCSP